MMEIFLGLIFFALGIHLVFFFALNDILDEIRKILEKWEG